jgi:hypothetical protein
MAPPRLGDEEQASSDGRPDLSTFLRPMNGITYASPDTL